jgi:hypothetical protein
MKRSISNDTPYANDLLPDDCAYGTPRVRQANSDCVGLMRLESDRGGN